MEFNQENAPATELAFREGLQFQDWGLIEYTAALQRQEELLELIAAKKLPGVFVFCSHPPIVTLGRKTQEGDVFAWQGPIQEISRGGRATYHGPSQLVVYPILNLSLDSFSGSHGWPQKDIGYLLRHLEYCIIQTLKMYGVQAVGKSLQKKNASDVADEQTGVWVGDKKVASLGIAVRKWVSYHGAAINLHFDPEAFMGMNPCGFNKSVMISLEELTGKKIDRNEFQAALQSEIKKVF